MPYYRRNAKRKVTRLAHKGHDLERRLAVGFAVAMSLKAD
jgi:hypothetical protein